MTRAWCGIPVYNNAGTIVDVAQRSRRQIERVLVIDDGSTDADLRDLLKPLDVAVERHANNQGKGVAILTALQLAADGGADDLITLDGDGQHDPEDIPGFLERLAPHTILLGSRDRVVGDMPFSSRFGREFSDFWICCQTGAALVDTQSGFRAYPVRDMLSLRLGSRHYNLEVEILTRAIWAGVVVRRVPIQVWYPDRSERISSFRPGLDNLRLSLLHARLVLRQLLPIPHRRLPDVPPAPNRSTADWFANIRKQNSTPMGLAAAAALSAFLAIRLWPWGPIVVAYLAWRLHLNKLACLATLACCLPPAVPASCLRVGRAVVGANANPRWAGFVGTHIVAFAAAPLMAVSVYLVARRIGSRLLMVAEGPPELAGERT